MKKWITSENAQQTVFIGPAFLAFAIIVAVPFLLGIYYSLTDWNGISQDISFIGLDNFVSILTDDPDFIRSFWFTFRFTLAVVAFSNLFGFMLAFILSKSLKSKSILRTLFFLPNVLGGLLLGFIWQFIFVQSFPPRSK